MNTNVTDIYRVNLDSNTPVKLEVFIGGGQLGLTSASLDGQQIIEEQEGDVEHNIGVGSEINGKKLVVVTMAKDVQSATNKTEVTFKLTNGVSEYTSGALPAEARKEFGVVIYTAWFRFYA